MEEKRFISFKEILEKYEKGERNFSNILCKGADFHGVNLSGSIFSNSDLSFNDFSGSTLTNCDFSNSKFDWVDFTLANLSGSKFVDAEITYSVLNDAIVEKTDFTRTNFDWSLLFNVRLHSAKIECANFTTAATDISQITEYGLNHTIEVLEKLKSRLPFSLWLLLYHSVTKTETKVQATKEVEKTVSTYKPKEHTDLSTNKDGYDAKTGVYIERPVYGFETQYTRRSKESKKETYTL